MNPKVSIIIPNYNHETFLQQRLDTVFNQTYQDFEVILLDDASTDGSIKLLETYKSHYKVSHLVINTVNSGSPFKQWQKGIGLAKGSYIWIAESDDYSDLNFLKYTVNQLLNGADICYTQSQDVDSSGTHLKSRLSYTAQFQPNIWEQDFVIDGSVFNETYFIVKNVIPNASAVIFKRELVKEIIFDNVLLNMRLCGDWLFWLQLTQNNRIAYLSMPLNYFRYHESSTRVHNKIHKRKLRLIEEASLRSVVHKRLNIRNEAQETQLYQNWFSLHGFIDVFTKAFYQVQMAQSSRKTLFLDFIFKKIKSI